MNDELPSVISGTRRQVRELVDGTLEVKFHVDPRFKADFHRLFPNIDTPVAIAPLVADFERREPTSEEPKGGPLCKLAAMWCKDEEFWEWLYEHYGQGVPVLNEEEAAELLRALCGVQSRSELDHKPEATARFLNLVRAPFMAWMKEQGK